MSALPNLRDDLVAGIARDRARRRRRWLRVGAAALPLAVAAVVVPALLPSGSSQSPAQALAQAADAASGHIVWTTTETPKVPTADGSTLGTNTMDVRYDGSDVAIDTQSALRQADGAERTVGQASTRIVDGVLYYGDQGAQPAQLATGVSAGDWLAHQTQALNALAAAAQTAADVSTQTADGATTYTATIDAAGLEIPGAPRAPVAYSLVTARRWPPALPSSGGPTSASTVRPPCRSRSPMARSRRSRSARPAVTSPCTPSSAVSVSRRASPRPDADPRAGGRYRPASMTASAATSSSRWRSLSPATVLAMLMRQLASSLLALTCPSVGTASGQGGSAISGPSATVPALTSRLRLARQTRTSLARTSASMRWSSLVVGAAGREGVACPVGTARV